MSARLHFSNSLDALADRLVENLGAGTVDPLATPGIATPSAAMRDWLKVRLAEKNGIAAGLAFSHLENLLWERLAERDRFRDAPGRLPAHLLDTFGFQGLVLAQLRKSPPAAIREYLRGSVPEDAARRLCQLAGRLASLFREYEYNRVSAHGHPGVAESWIGGHSCFAGQLERTRANHPARRFLEEVRSLEAWQMEVYHAVFRKEDGLRDQWGAATGIYRYTLPQYAGLALENPVTPGDFGDPPVYHLFGLSNISPFHRDLIGQLADAGRLGEGAARFEIYALNPCAEFWEDALTLKERRARGRRPLAARAVPRSLITATRPHADETRAAEIADDPDENGLLALFGKPGRETIKLWCELTGHDFHEDFREPEGAGLLATVRRSVLHRAGAERGTEADTTLQLRSAADPRAELEAVRAEIMEHLRADPGLLPEECAVIPANPDDALPLLRAAFAGGKDAPNNAPVLLPEGVLPEENPLLRGFRALLALGEGRADRRDIMAFFDNPAVQRKTGLGPDRLPAVAAFLEATGFQEGWEGGPASAKAALERAVLARALDADDPTVAASEAWPAHHALALLEREDAARVIDCLDSLRTGTLPLRDTAPRPWAEWAELLRALRDAFLEADPGDARAANDLRRFLDDLGLWGQWSGDGSETADATLIRTVFEDRFRGAAGPSASGGLLRGGVRVGSLSALRGIPFRHVWVTGLSASFPSPGEAAPLDLRGYHRLPGESEPAARDLYALLETITAATGSISLSWPRRDAAGKDLQPSRALTGIAAWLEGAILAEGCRVDPGHEALQPPAAVPPRTADLRAEGWAETTRAAAVIDWKELQDFLGNPAWRTVRRRFRVDAWEALDAAEDERSAALFLDRRGENALLEPALRAELREPGTGSRVFGQAWEARRRGGMLPPPPYDALEEERLRALLDRETARSIDTLRDALDASGLRFAGSLRIGPQGFERATPPVINLPAFDASSLGITARIGGILPWFFLRRGHSEDGAGWGLLADEGREFPAWLFQLCASALDAPPELRAMFEGPARLFIRGGKDGRIKERPLPGLDANAARAFLRDLLADFIEADAEGRGDDLPLLRIEGILGGSGHPQDAAIDWRDAIAEARRTAEESSSATLPFSERVLEALASEVPQDADAQIRRRVLPYLGWKAALNAKAGAAENDA